MWRASRISLVALLIGGVGTVLLLNSSPLLVAADSDITSKICAELDAPTLTQPAVDAETQEESITVEGVAVAGQLVTILRNNTGAGTVTAAPDGTFMMLLPLVPGVNEIRAQVTNECSTIRSSPSVTITRPIAEPPLEESPVDEPEQVPIESLEPVTGRAPSERGGQGITQTPQTGGDQHPLAKPRITYPTNGLQVSEGQLRVTGTADAGSVVILFVNGEAVAQLSVSAGGNWATLVGLSPGSNTIQAQASRDGQTAVSEPVVVDYTRRGVSRLIDRPYSITVQIICILLVLLIIGAAIFMARRRHLLHARLSRKKKRS